MLHKNNHSVISHSVVHLPFRQLDEELEKKKEITDSHTETVPFRVQIK